MDIMGTVHTDLNSLAEACYEQLRAATSLLLAPSSLLPFSRREGGQSRGGGGRGRGAFSGSGPQQSAAYLSAGWLISMVTGHI